MIVRFILALWAARLAMFVARVTGRGKGSSLPGKIALKIYPRILKQLGRQIKKGIIVVTGTNGKTTTNNMIAGIVGDNKGSGVIINREGANLITGVTAAFIRAAGPFGGLHADYACLEVDEASFPGVVREITPDIVVVTNFFRDQLDRYGELDKTIALVKDALKKLDSVRLVLNADDPLVAQLGRVTGKPSVFFGLARHPGVSGTGSAAREAKFCPFCGAELAYSYYQYSQLGNYKCPGCEFARPQTDVEGVDPGVDGMLVSCRVRFRQGNMYPLQIPVTGLYNLYNGLAACSVGLLLDIDMDGIRSSLAGYLPATGRMEKFLYRGKPVLLNLVKNPTGFNEGLSTLLSVPAERVNVLIAINDNDADGRDISWLWDVDFEVLSGAGEKFGTFVCSGRRAWEMAVRLKYAGVREETVTVLEDFDQAVRTALEGTGDMSYFLATYTALWPVERILSGYAQRERTLPESVPSISGSVKSVR
ncbi:amidotransferase [Desulfocucumis palustris]|uniref:Lipid II isoglutaminyl synthase (glutamine-hydrolyzing) subunit MurT n=1 Tax=Desulfocucumis palustris TaxID=1898651 RepID=A0A2L2XC89_9FIRM|nr:MurT ligase domain-containing protein [Desulfocucumis palustris]GBF33614.1 amidotransferase [Desulfocucumis palustris]